MAESQHISSKFIPDRGPARYFHGRKKILRNFNELLQYASEKTWGTIFLIQGAPGAGKSALLYECEKLAGSGGWKTSRIHAPALWEVDELRQSLDSKRKLNIEGGAAKVAIPGIAEAGVSAELPPQTVKGLLQKGKVPLLLILDEAQVLGTTNKPSGEQAKIASNVVDVVHNGTLGRPVVLIAGGLGTTLKSFEALGISRFAEDCFVELGALSKKSERAVIQDWLNKEGRAKGDPTAWIDAIAKETQGWPRHVQSYSKRAADYLEARDGIMTVNGLKAVLEAGRRGRAVYYKQRVDRFRGDQIRCLAMSIAGVPHGKPAEYKDIMSLLVNEYGESKANKLFDRFIEKGLLEESGIGYAVPIPSMHTWLTEEYAFEKIEIPQDSQSKRISIEQNPGKER